MGPRVIVADTNLIVYLLVAGPHSADAQRAFDRDGVWVAPAVWRYEMLNVLATSVRNRLLERDRAVDAWIHAPAFIKDADVDALDVLDLSVSSNFATFDCYYVELARKLGCRVVTADRKMLQGFQDVAISIQDFGAGG